MWEQGRGTQRGGPSSPMAPGAQSRAPDHTQQCRCLEAPCEGVSPLLWCRLAVGQSMKDRPSKSTLK